VWKHHSLLSCHAVQYCHLTPWPVGPYEDAIDLFLLDFADDCTHHAERAIDVDQARKPNGLRCGPWVYHSIYPLAARAVELGSPKACHTIGFVFAHKRLCCIFHAANHYILQSW